MIEIGHKRLRNVRQMVIDHETGKRKLVNAYDSLNQPITEMVANEPVRVTRGRLNGHFFRDSGRKLVVALKDGDILELRPQGCRKGTYAATLFDVYSWMIQNHANKEKMAKLRAIKEKKEESRRLRALRRPIKQ